MKTISTLAAVAGLALSGSALAVDLSTSLNTTVDLKTVDANKDGKVTKSEAAANAELTKQFATLDANKDGSLDKAEFARFEAKGSAKGGAGGESGAPAGTTDDMAPASKDPQPAPR